MLIIHSKHEGPLSVLRGLNSEAPSGVIVLCFGTRQISEGMGYPVSGVHGIKP